MNWERLWFPIGYDVKIAGNYTISIKSLERIPESTQIILEDTENGTFVDLRKESYTFYSGRASVKDRFLIHFLPGYTVTDPQLNEDNQTIAENEVQEITKAITDKADQIQLYAAHGSVYIKTSGDYDVQGEVKVFDMNGKEILSRQVDPGFTKVALNVESGYYILSYVSDLHAERKKIFIE